MCAGGFVVSALYRNGGFGGANATPCMYACRVKIALINVSDVVNEVEMT